MSGSAELDPDVNLSEIRAGIDAATGWLLDHVDTGDLPAVTVATFRVPYTLVLVGRRADAARVLSWMERHVLDATGDLQPGPMREAFAEKWSSYPLAIIAKAAWHLERYQTAESIHRTLTRFQDPVTGGAYAERPELRTTRRQDLFPTAQLGMTALTLGDDALADGAFRWLTSLYDLQPELPQRLYTATDGERLMSWDAEIGADRFGLVTDFHAPRQAFYNPGIAAAFLARFSAQRGVPAARQLADSFLALTEQGGPQQYDHSESVQLCKFAWGAAALLDLGPDRRYLGHVSRMARWFLVAQHPDGHWQNSPFLLPDGPTTASNVEVTAEFIQHLVIISGAMAGSCDVAS